MVKRSYAAHFYAVQCATWAAATNVSLDGTIELLRERRSRDIDPGYRFEVAGSAMSAVVTAELALWGARWVIANREGALELLPYDWWDQVDVAWQVVVLRRDALVHPEGWRSRHAPRIGVIRGAIDIAGFPRMDIWWLRTWMSVLGHWSRRLIGDPPDADDVPATHPAPLDFESGPEWARSTRRVPRRKRGRQRTD